MSQDTSYYAARVAEERRLAMASIDPRVRRTHLELAANYAMLAGPTPNLAEDDSPELQRKSA